MKPASDDKVYLKSIVDWRKEKDLALKDDHGWLALDGLFWLVEGENPFYIGDNHRIVFGQDDPVAGIIQLENGIVTLIPSTASGLVIDGQPARKMELKPDITGEPTMISMANLDMKIIRRGERFGIRVWNKNRNEKLNFQGRLWFPVRTEYVLKAVFQPQEDHREILIPDVTGALQAIKIAGVIHFNINKRPLSLLALDEGEGDLFIIFKDETNGKETYPAGRYLYTTAKAGGNVVLDFNKAYCPPCAFTEFATCPLPPPQNRLPIRIEAGELKPVL